MLNFIIISLTHNISHLYISIYIAIEAKFKVAAKCWSCVGTRKKWEKKKTYNIISSEREGRKERSEQEQRNLFIDSASGKNVTKVNSKRGKPIAGRILPAAPGCAIFLCSLFALYGRSRRQFDDVEFLSNTEIWWVSSANIKLNLPKVRVKRQYLYLREKRMKMKFKQSQREDCELNV